jgi:hypothetical protein
MTSVSITLTGETLEPRGDVLEIRDSIAENGLFINVDFTPNVSVILPGFDADAVASARLIAAKLTELADEAESKLAASVAR